ncbi:hypothetical protein SSCG_01950 [Streptomyces clavuligerus]|nr:hypothetical protein SSCG_01950 [Streptomyces clavuligerus]
MVIGEGGGDKHTLAHELTHVVQQRQGPVAGTDNGTGLRVSDPSDHFERAAEANARAVMSGPVPERPESAEEAGSPGRAGARGSVQRAVTVGDDVYSDSGKRADAEPDHEKLWAHVEAVGWERAARVDMLGDAAETAGLLQAELGRKRLDGEFRDTLLGGAREAAAAIREEVLRAVQRQELIDEATNEAEDMEVDEDEEMEVGAGGHDSSGLKEQIRELTRQQAETLHRLVGDAEALQIQLNRARDQVKTAKQAESINNAADWSDDLRSDLQGEALRADSQLNFPRHEEGMQRQLAKWVNDKGAGSNPEGKSHPVFGRKAHNQGYPQVDQLYDGLYGWVAQKPERHREKEIAHQVKGNKEIEIRLDLMLAKILRWVQSSKELIGVLDGVSVIDRSADQILQLRQVLGQSPGAIASLDTMKLTGFAPFQVAHLQSVIRRSPAELQTLDTQPFTGLTPQQIVKLQEIFARSPEKRYQELVEQLETGIVDGDAYGTYRNYFDIDLAEERASARTPELAAARPLTGIATQFDGNMLAVLTKPDKYSMRDKVVVLHDVTEYFYHVRHAAETLGSNLIPEVTDDEVMTTTLINKDGSRAIGSLTKGTDKDNPLKLLSRDEDDPSTKLARLHNVPVWVGQSETASRIMKIGKLAGADNQELEAAAWALFAFWRLDYDHTVEWGYHTLHEVLDMAHNFGVEYNMLNRDRGLRKFQPGALSRELENWRAHFAQEMGRLTAAVADHDGRAASAGLPALGSDLGRLQGMMSAMEKIDSPLTKAERNEDPDLPAMLREYALVCQEAIALYRQICGTLAAGAPATQGA